MTVLSEPTYLSDTNHRNMNENIVWVGEFLLKRYTKEGF